MKIIVFHQPFPMGNYKVNKTIAKWFSNDKNNEVYYLEQLNGRIPTQEYVDQIISLKPDVVYYEMLDLQTFLVIEKLNCEKILLYASKGVLENEYELLQYKNKWYTKILTNSINIAQIFKNNNIPTETFEYYYSSLTDEELIYNENYNYDCVFLGMGFNRLSEVDYTLERNLFYNGFSEFNFAIHGNGWPSMTHYKGVLPENDVGSLYHSCKSSIAQIGKNQRNNGQINGRYSEIMFAKCPLLTYPYPSVNWYGAEKDIIFVKTREDIINVVNNIKTDLFFYKTQTDNLKQFIVNKTQDFFYKLNKLLNI